MDDTSPAPSSSSKKFVAYGVGAVVIAIGLMFELGDWSSATSEVRFGGSLIAAFGSAIVAIGRRVFGGSLGVAIEQRRTSLVILLLALLLFGLLFVAAVAIVHDNAVTDASSTRWMISTLFLATTAGANVLLAMDVLGRLRGGFVRRSSST